VRLFFLPVIFLCFFTESVMSEPAPVPYPEVASLAYDPAEKTLSYGDDPLQFGEYWPSEPGAPLLLLIHGGCWLQQFTLEHVRPLASRLASEGIAVLSIEYRRIGDPGGGFPGTFEDITRAALMAEQLPHESMFVAGHSAGGHLALWLAGTIELSKLKGAIGLAAISNLDTYAVGQSGCEKATSQLLGGMPNEVPERYQAASPHRLEFAPSVLLLHGDKDPIVSISQSEQFCLRQNCELVTLSGSSHFDLIDPRQAVVQQITGQIAQWLAP
jgi:acetyl esterase/lipase